MSVESFFRKLNDILGTDGERCARLTMIGKRFKYHKGKRYRMRHLSLIGLTDKDVERVTQTWRLSMAKN